MSLFITILSKRPLMALISSQPHMWYLQNTCVAYIGTTYLGCQNFLANLLYSLIGL